ncbi:MAG: response regulator transcription factor [Candidatus Competibacteraceae bacterium]|nr:response regulator transcription factor [Candidatus Competibacteraceae bacterium]
MEDNNISLVHILYVEDDQNLGMVVKDLLEEQNYTVTLCTDGQSAIQKFGTQSFDLCILDIMLPHQDGYEVAEFIRKINTTVPIIFLSAKSLSEDRIKGLKIGADDYITKPFSTEELVLRVSNILKRSQGVSMSPENKDIFELGIYVFNYPEFVLIKGEDSRHLTEREANLLRILCLHKNQVITREILLKSVWGKDDYFTGRSMDVFISKLRKYLSADERIKIQVVHGIGFKLIVPEN